MGRSEKPLFTVVIPFYKGEKYIRQAVNSLLLQPYKNIELLLINDGSPIGSDICEAIAEADTRIRYYQKENEGSGAARNLGIELAKGDWIAFLDADDIWAKNFLTEELVLTIGSSEADVVSFSYYASNDDFSRGTLVRVEEKAISGGIDAAQNNRCPHSSMFFSKRLLSNTDVRFALSRRHEDVIFLQKALYLADRIVLIDKVMFLYRNNIYSETHRGITPEELYGPLLASWRELLDWHITQHPDDRKAIATVKHMICVYAMEAVEMLYKTGINEKEAETIVDKYFCRDYLDHYKEIVLSQNRIDQIGFYYDHREEFIRKWSNIGRKEARIIHFKKMKWARYLNSFFKYKEAIPKSYISEIG